ncbi:MAG TPA: beta-galactosidase [Phycisphaerae bacterium]|nr:hypothetical protein [Phycisphaerae bacterium]HOB74075.1 beta-galactosidase [Phycisphaerae bacterium]HOJ56483.1 beta-galactosidase [Phycisphaerae bacterium]HOL25399.1 beta-galactosidase [Phycisphaerae bacterium]HPP22075.1 beta-galactosidase [Phycisphaerae bacterium]
MTSGRCLAVGLMALMAAAPALGNEKPAETFFPVSTWYSGGKARAPMLSTLTPQSREEWGRDLDQIKKLGFNTVRTWVEWAHCEPREGEFRFDNLKLLCELARERDLRVIVQIYADSAPDWVGRKYPDALLEAQSGEKVPSQAAPGYCTDHHGVREAMLNFYTQAARVAVQYPNLHAWDLWSEPHILNWAIIDYVPNAQFCFCPHTRAEFRRWLKAKYGDLAGVNKAWYRNFEEWEQVDPPRFGTILSYTDFIDWKSFIYDRLAGDLRRRYEAVRKADPTHTITSHAAVPSIFTGPFVGAGAPDDFLMARQLEYYGTSIYPKHSFPNTHWPMWQIAVAMDFSRSANIPNGGFYIGELQAGPGARGVVIGNPITPVDHRIWLWSAVARGAKAVNFYAYYPMSSGYESNGYGLIELDGKVTDRAEESGRNARIVHENRELILNSKPVPARIAIVYNPLAQMVGGEQHSGPANAHRDSLIGYWRAFWEANIPVDFVHRQWVEKGDLAQYKLLIVPYPIMWTQAAADGLKKFIEKGGAVVAEARLAWNDDRGYAAEVIPGMGLSEVFGVREKSARMSEQVKIRDEQGDELVGGYLAESFDLLPGSQARVLAKLEDGSPVVVESSYGRGRTMIVGSFLGLAAQKTRDAGTLAGIRKLVGWAGIEPPARVNEERPADEPLELRLRRTTDGYLMFVFNHASAPRKATASVKIDQPGTYTARDLLTGDEQPCTNQDGQLAIQLDFKDRDVKVLHVRSRQ